MWWVRRGGGGGPGGMSGAPGRYQGRGVCRRFARGVNGGLGVQEGENGIDAIVWFDSAVKRCVHGFVWHE